ncbi:hypothetical protein [Methylocucumis oryzae]|uniref:hypothetical protein n=1 Tax=Methylocucumis oryzae TaxID=1632867 RepID=UPI0019552DDD|nr:hypothetical protein [Methylocucumis oryzae]
MPELTVQPDGAVFKPKTLLSKLSENTVAAFAKGVVNVASDNINVRSNIYKNLN